MPSRFQLDDLIRSVAPHGLCGECIRDRMPLSERAHLQDLLADLPSPELERVRGECVGCQQPREVIRLL
jgi:hypothetical protein